MMNTPDGEVLQKSFSNSPAQSDWLEQVKVAAAKYRVAQNNAQDASDALTAAISGARAMGVPEAQILSVITL